ncbi:DUF3320 domain-containing protein [Methanosarcina mazei]|nr:DUF3320 domain-containing protein [Methanosarcina mazei]
MDWDQEPEITPETGKVAGSGEGVKARNGSAIENEVEITVSGSNPQKGQKPGPGSIHEADNPDLIGPDPSENAKKEDEELSVKGNSLEAPVPSYRVCLSSGLPQSSDLSEISDAQLEDAIVNIVEFEGPIHSEEILQRIRSHTGFPRMLGKIRQRILDSVASAESSGKIQVRGEFCWPLYGPSDLLRRRDTESYARIEWICDEEIKEAVRFVLTSQYSTPMDDLIIQTSRVLGIKTTRKNTWDRIEKLIQSGIESNELTRTPNEMIYFVE